MKRLHPSLLLICLLWPFLWSCDSGLNEPTEEEMRELIESQWEAQQDVIQEDLLPITIVEDAEGIAALRSKIDDETTEDGLAESEQLVRTYCRGYHAVEEQITAQLDGDYEAITEMLYGLQVAGCTDLSENEAITGRLSSLLADDTYHDEVLDLVALSEVGIPERALLQEMQNNNLGGYDKAYRFLAISHHPETTSPLREMEFLLYSDDSYDVPGYLVQESFTNYLNCSRPDLRKEAWRIAHEYFEILDPSNDHDHWGPLFQAICSYKDPAAAPIIRAILDTVDTRHTAPHLLSCLSSLASLEGEKAVTLIDKYSDQMSNYDLLNIYGQLSGKIGKASSTTTQKFIDRMRSSGIFLTFADARQAMEIIRRLDPDAGYDKYRHLFERLKNSSGANMESFWALYDLEAIDLVRELHATGLIAEMPETHRVEGLAKQFGNHCSDREMISQFLNHYLTYGSTISADDEFPSDYAWLIRSYFAPLCDGNLDNLQVSYSYDQQSRGTRYEVRMIVDEVGYEFESFDKDMVFNLDIVVRAMNKVMAQKGDARRLIRLDRTDGIPEFVLAEPIAFKSFAEKFKLELFDH